MKTWHILSIAALCIMASSVFADRKAPSRVKSHPNSMFQIGANYTRADIKPQESSRFSGNMGGVQTLYEYRPMNCIYAGLKGMWRQGNTTVDGDKIYLIDVNVQERIGYTFATCDQLFLSTLFTGVGYRYLGNGLTEGDSSMDQNYNEFYIPLGLLTDIKINSFTTFGLYLTWMPQVNSSVNLIPVKGSRWSLRNELVNFLLEVPLNFYMGCKSQYAICFKPFYEYWQSGHSTADTTTGVPLGLVGKTYNYWGAELNFGYKF